MPSGEETGTQLGASIPLCEDRRILIITAVAAECDAVLKGLNDTGRFVVIPGGVGQVSAAVSTAKALAGAKYSLVLSVGIGGGFPDRAAMGSLVLANAVVAADLGAETAEGFNSLEDLDLGTNHVTLDPNLVDRVYEGLRAAKLPVIKGPILTVSTVTGTAASAEEMALRVQGAAAEGMEGYGVALAAQAYGVPALEIRAISNLVGPRDRANWQIKEALDALTSLSSKLAEVLLP